MTAPRPITLPDAAAGLRRALPLALLLATSLWLLLAAVIGAGMALWWIVGG